MSKTKDTKQLFYLYGCLLNNNKLSSERKKEALDFLLKQTDLDISAREAIKAAWPDVSLEHPSEETCKLITHYLLNPNQLTADQQELAKQYLANNHYRELLLHLPKEVQDLLVKYLTNPALLTVDERRKAEQYLRKELLQSKYNKLPHALQELTEQYLIEPEELSSEELLELENYWANEINDYAALTNSPRFPGGIMRVRFTAFPNWFGAVTWIDYDYFGAATNVLDITEEKLDRKIEENKELFNERKKSASTEMEVELERENKPHPEPH